MSKLHHPALHLVCAVAIASGLVAAACVGSDDDVDPQTGGTGGTDTGGTSGGIGGGNTAGTGGGNTAGTGGNTGGTGGGDAGVTLPLCTTKSALSGTSPIILNFEALTAADASTTFETNMVQVGTYVYMDPLDTTATSMRAFIAGHDTTSLQAVSTSIHSSTWGGGVGLWFNPGCLDATAYTGVSFWVKSPAPPGTMPAGTVLFSLNMVETVETAGGGDCATAPCASPSHSFVVTDTWQQITLTWADFTPGTAGTTMVTANGDNITGLNFNLGNDNTARDIVLDLDDFEFLTN